MWVRAVLALVTWLVSVIYAIVAAPRYELLVVGSLAASGLYLHLVYPFWRGKRSRWVVGIATIPLIFLSLHTLGRLQQMLMHGEFMR